MIDKAIAARASGDTNPVSALGEVVASVFDVDLNDVCDSSCELDCSDDASEYAEDKAGFAVAGAAGHGAGILSTDT